jgi:3',5'-cyclic AMP phosphodiesterase CpdA
MRFLHFSDVHVTADYRRQSLLRLGWRRWIALGELTFGGRANAFARAPETIGRILEDAHALQVDHVILSGDLTAYALPVEFEGARKALGPWAEEPRRCTVIPGNHDRYTPGAHRTRRFEQTFGNLLVSDLPDVAVEEGFPFVRLLGERDAVIGLQSARVPYFPGLSYGVVGKAQRRALAALLRRPELDGRAVLVVVHHAPFGALGKPDRLLHGLVDAPALLKMLPGERFAVLHGHIHQRYHFPATDRRPHIFGAGSSTQAGHEGYWLIETSDGRIANCEKRNLAS